MSEHLERGGRYFRVCHPTWVDCGDTSYSRKKGGRWNPPNSFGVLYLNASVAVAAAQARENFAGEAFRLEDLRPGSRPDLQAFDVSRRDYVDAVTDPGLEALGLPPSYPWKIDHSTCQPVGESCYRQGEDGIACRSAAECSGPGVCVGEELALFDRDAEGTPPAAPGPRQPFSDWYPGR